MFRTLFCNGLTRFTPVCGCPNKVNAVNTGAPLGSNLTNVLSIIFLDTLYMFDHFMLAGR